SECASSCQEAVTHPRDGIGVTRPPESAAADDSALVLWAVAKPTMPMATRGSRLPPARRDSFARIAIGPQAPAAVRRGTRGIADAGRNRLGAHSSRAATVGHSVLGFVAGCDIALNRPGALEVAQAFVCGCSWAPSKIGAIWARSASDTEIGRPAQIPPS